MSRGGREGGLRGSGWVSICLGRVSLWPLLGKRIGQDRSSAPLPLAEALGSNHSSTAGSVPGPLHVLSRYLCLLGASNPKCCSLEPGKVPTCQSSAVFRSPCWPPALLSTWTCSSVHSLCLGDALLLLLFFLPDPAHSPGLVLLWQGSRDPWDPREAPGLRLCIESEA